MTTITPAAKTWWIAYGRTKPAPDGRDLPVVLHHGVVEPGNVTSIAQPTVEQFTSEEPWRIRIRALGGEPPEIENEEGEAEVDEAPTDPYARLAYIRWEREVGGLALPDGRAIRTTRESQSQLSSATLAYQSGSLTEPTTWKLESGWVELDAAQIAGIAGAVAKHVQACFKAERDVLAQLDAMDDPWSANVAALFGNAYTARVA